jgi:hypothetical protein
LTGPVPDPDKPATGTERSHAKTFGELVDKSLSGTRLPPAMSADDRALLEVATVIRAAHGNAELGASRTRSIVEDALRQAVGGATSGTSGNVTSIETARSRRWAPWVIAGASAVVAVAALLLFWLRPAPHVAPRATAQQIPVQWKSRPTDDLIGPIAPERVGDASTRIDTIFADRLDGYRDRTLAGRGRKP